MPRFTIVGKWVLDNAEGGKGPTSYLCATVTAAILLAELFNAANG